MPYCIYGHIIHQIDTAALIQLTDDAGTGQIDTAVIDGAIADADAEIDGYCGTRYPLPLSPVPPIIAKLSVDMAVYNLFARREHVPEARAKRYDNALRFLASVARGQVSLGADAPAEDSQDGASATTSRDDRVFTLGRNGTPGTLDNY